MTDYDLVVLGAGATGLGAARSARKAGRSVALIEPERPGGDCTHFGCVPSKAMLETARRVHAARSGSPYGFTATPKVDFAAVMKRVHAVIGDIEQDESPAQLASEGIDLIQGAGIFTDEHTVDVDGRKVRAKRFIVATGSKAAIPPIDGLKDIEYLDNTTIFSLTELPSHLLVLGGGPIGVELAQAFRRLGADVTVLEAAPSIVIKEEPEAQEVLTAALEREGVTLMIGKKVVRASAGPTLHLEDGTSVSGSHLLVAVGRTPTTDGLGLEGVGVKLDGKRIVTDSHLKAADTIWAAGDVTAKLQFTHVGNDQGRIAAGNAFAKPFRSKSWSDDAIPWVTFTEPEIGHVGMSEKQAFDKYGDSALVSIVRDTHSDRGRTAGETDGFVKLVAKPGPVGGMLLGKLVGMTIVGPMAGEQIALGALAMNTNMLVGRLAQTTVAYPTWNLTVRIAASRFFGSYGGSPARPAKG